jgi:hypothetical protein
LRRFSGGTSMCYFLFFAHRPNSCRQVPSLQWKASKCKRRRSRPSHGSRPNPVDRILAQRARRAEINANYHQATEDHSHHRGPQPLWKPVQQQPPRQHASQITEVDDLNESEEREPPIQATQLPTNEDKSEPELESEEEEGFPRRPSLMAKASVSAPVAQDSNHPLATAAQKRVGLICYSNFLTLQLFFEAQRLGEQRAAKEASAKKGNHERKG